MASSSAHFFKVLYYVATCIVVYYIMIFCIWTHVLGCVLNFEALVCLFEP